MTRWFIGALAAGLLFAPGVWAAGDATAGATLVEQQCVMCHLRDTTPRSPNSPPSFREIVRGRKLTRDEMRTFLHKSHYPMPPKALSTSQVEDLIAYFEEQGYWP